MTIEEFAITSGQEIVCRYPCGLCWAFCLRGAELLIDGELNSPCGFGPTIGTARQNYLGKIRGKRIVFNAHKLDRAEFAIPETIE
jgi:hypothetical protein